MREEQIPMHYTSADEIGRVRPGVDSGNSGVHITPERVTHVEARPAGNYLAFDLPNSVHVTLTKGVISTGSDKAVAVGPRALPGPSRDSKLGTWLLASAVISVTTLYTICNPKWLPSFVAQTVKISKPLSADIKRRASTPLRGTAVTDTAKAGAGTLAGVTRNSVVRDVRPAAPASLTDVDRSTAEHHGSSSGAHRTLAAPSKSKNGFMVPPPPPTPCVLPPAVDFFLMQPAQQHAAPQNMPQQSTAASGTTEPTQSAVADQEREAADQQLQAADQELQAALRSSLRTVGEWTR